jgi:hypothetical protein
MVLTVIHEPLGKGSGTGVSPRSHILAPCPARQLSGPRFGHIGPEFFRARFSGTCIGGWKTWSDILGLRC